MQMWVPSIQPITYGNEEITKKSCCTLTFSACVSGILMYIGFNIAKTWDVLFTIFDTVLVSIPIKSAMDERCPPVA